MAFCAVDDFGGSRVVFRKAAVEPLPFRRNQSKLRIEKSFWFFTDKNKVTILSTQNTRFMCTFLFKRNINVTPKAVFIGDQGTVALRNLAGIADICNKLRSLPKPHTAVENIIFCHLMVIEKIIFDVADSVFDFAAFDFFSKFRIAAINGKWVEAFEWVTRNICLNSGNGVVTSMIF